MVSVSIVNALLARVSEILFGLMPDSFAQTFAARRKAITNYVILEIHAKANAVWHGYGIEKPGSFLELRFGTHKVPCVIR